MPLSVPGSTKIPRRPLEWLGYHLAYALDWIASKLKARAVKRQVGKWYDKDQAPKS